MIWVIFMSFLSIFLLKLRKKNGGPSIGRSWGTSRDETVKMISLNWRP